MEHWFQLLFLNRSKGLDFLLEFLPYLIKKRINNKKKKNIKKRKNSKKKKLKIIEEFFKYLKKKI